MRKIGDGWVPIILIVFILGFCSARSSDYGAPDPCYEMRGC